VRLTVLGCSGSFPSVAGPCSSYLVEADGFRLLLDLGNGALGPLQSAIGLYDVDAVVISHLHTDHCIDLCSYYVARRYRPGGVPPVIPVLGPAGTADRLARGYDMPERPGMSDVFDIATLAPGRRELGPFALTVDRVNHPVETFAVRLEHGGRSLAYSADTGRSDALVRLAGGADVLLCEASFLDGEPNPPDLHLTGQEAGEHAARAGVGRLLLTHLTAWGDADRTIAEATATFDGATEVVVSGRAYRI
jgi:ribonuclease BN (tRNA processing enzyme)